MNPFGRDVASRTLASVLSALILAGLVAIWGFVKVFGPVIASRYLIEGRELTAWTLVVLLIGLLAFVLARQSAAPSTPSPPASVALTLNNGVKPSVTLTHHGSPTTYHVDGHLVALIDGSPNPWPTRFQCQIQKSGITGNWEMPLSDGEWANVIFGSIEPIMESDSMGNSYPIGDRLVIRRGKQGQHVEVPDTGAVVELRIRTTPPLSVPTAPKQFRIVKQDAIATVTEVN